MHQKHTRLSNNFRVNFARKHLYQTNNHLHFTIQTHSPTLRRANDKLFHIYRKLIFGSRLRFLYTSTATTAGKTGPLLWWYALKKLHESATLGEIKQIRRTRFTPNKWLQLLLPVTTVSSEKRWGRVMLLVTTNVARQTDLQLCRALLLLSLQHMRLQTTLLNLFLETCIQLIMWSR